MTTVKKERRRTERIEVAERIFPKTDGKSLNITTDEIINQKKDSLKADEGPSQKKDNLRIKWKKAVERRTIAVTDRANAMTTKDRKITENTTIKKEATISPTDNPEGITM